MAKVHLNLSIEKEIHDLAKTSNFNLSEEFEDWLRVRLNMKNKDILEQNGEDPDKLIAEYRMKIQKLQSVKEMKKEEDMKKTEQEQIMDFQIENMIKNNEPLEEPFDPLRIRGIQFVFKKKFNIIMNTLEARESLSNRIQEYLKIQEEQRKLKEQEE